MAKEAFIIEHEILGWECAVEINHDHTHEYDGKTFTTADAIKMMVDFWSGSEHRLAMNEGDYTKTFLQDLGRKILYIILEHDYNHYGVVKQFEEEEGWCKMDGSFGVTILRLDALEFEHSEFTVRKPIGQD